MKTSRLNYDMLLLTAFTIVFASLTFVGAVLSPISDQSAQTNSPYVASNEMRSVVAAPLRVIGTPFIPNTDPSVR